MRAGKENQVEGKTPEACRYPVEFSKSWASAYRRKAIIQEKGTYFIASGKVSRSKRGATASGKRKEVTTQGVAAVKEEPQDEKTFVRENGVCHLIWGIMKTETTGNRMLLICDRSRKGVHLGRERFTYAHEEKEKNSPASERKQSILRVVRPRRM